eukprot:TRINITY_DN5560_c0_g1_i3.p1 TRINITY_DN5560_c0_g1~~TRINITY_DN5560_c0_g1_i3.p1  ORF type:complete len:2438 (-),score=486.40 TRINITY_DN5560_c0_g1_i3:51-7364(-)
MTTSATTAPHETATKPDEARAATHLDAPNFPICIVGIGCRLPGGCNNAADFYTALLNGLDAMRPVPASRWDASWLDNPSRMMGTIDGLDYFDAKFFGLPPVEASRMDPQHRILLEASVHALQDAGLRLSDVAASRTGVFVGCSSQEYAVIQLQPAGFPSINGQTNTGVCLSIASNRISYLLDLRGPSFTVDTACSSSLLAVHLAVSALRRGECPLALAAGANALIGPGSTLGFARGGFLSPDGHCKAFDASANGFARSEGSVCLILEPMDAAIKNHHRVYATILGTAANEGGHGEGGMTHPSERAQREVIEAAVKDAGIAASAVSYVEAHGTGTAVGDPIEASAIASVFGTARPRGSPCLIGSVKSNVGHLEPASGVVGLAKLALSLFHGTIPKNLHFHSNPAIKFDELNVEVVTKNTALPQADAADGIYAGINSFGFGGANVHCVVRGPPARCADLSAPSVSESRRSIYVLCLSARSATSLATSARDYMKLLSQPDVTLEKVCRAAHAARDEMDMRVAVAASTKEEAVQRLTAFAEWTPASGALPDGVTTGRAPDDRRPRIAFVCSGQGPQWPLMARQLMAEEPVFAAVIHRLDELLGKMRPGWSLLEELERPKAESHISDTYVCQPCLMAVHIGLAALWRSRGLQPAGVVGHSVGEVAAAYIAGALSLEQAAYVIHHRSRVQALAAGTGRMLAIGLTEPEAQALLPVDGSVSIAAVNSPRGVTLSGDAAPLAAIAQRLEAQRIFARFLHVDTPFHSRRMEQLRQPLLDSLADLKPSLCDEHIELYSTVTGQREDGTHAGAEHWYRNVRGMVFFDAAIRAMIGDGYNVFVEMSPHPALATSMRETARSLSADVLIVTSMRNGDADESAELAKAESLLFCWGVAPQVQLDRSDVALGLPLYEWDREHYWNEAPEATRARIGAQAHPHLRVQRQSLRETSNSLIDLCFDFERDHWYLRDHVINGQIVLPAATYTDAALSAGVQLYREKFCFIEDVHLLRAMFLPAEARLDVSSDRGCFFVYSRPSSGDEEAAWTLNCEGRINALQDEFERRRTDMTLDACRRVCAEETSPAAIYASLTAVGLGLGPAFNCMQQLWLGPGRQCLARCVLKPEMAADPRHARFGLHPTLMDAAIISLFAPLGWEPTMGGFLPNHIDRAALFAPGKASGPELWAHSVIVDTCESSFTADMRFMLPTGELVAEIHGFRLKLIPGSSDRRTAAALGAYHRYAWIEDTVVTAEAKTEAAITATSLVLTDAAEADSAVAAVAATLPNARVVCGVTPDNVGNVAKVDDAGAVALLLAPLTADKDGAEAAERATLVVVALAQAVCACQRSRAPRIVAVVTRGAMAEDGPVALSHAAAWGTARVAMLEATPATGCVFALVDVPALCDEADAAALRSHVRALLEGSRWVPEAAVRGGRVLQHRLEREPANARAPHTVELPSCGGQYIAAMPARGGSVLKNMRLEYCPRGPISRPLATGTIEVAVRAASLNFRDVLCAIGMLSPEAIEGSCWGHALGCEFAGVVTRVADDIAAARRWKTGDEVVGMALHCLAGSVVTRADSVVAKPAWLPFEMAAAVPLTYVTAHYSLTHQCRLRRGEWLLLHSAAGGVGIAALNIAREIGANVIATASPSKHEFLRKLGCKHILDSGSLRFRDEVMRITNGHGVDVVLNSLSGRAIAQSVRCLAPFGRFVEIGKTDIYRDSKLSMRCLANNCSWFAVDIDKMTAKDPSLTMSLFLECLDIISCRRAAGTLIEHPLNTYPLSRVAEAFAALATGKTLGKTICVTDREDTVAAEVPDDAVWAASGALDAHGAYIVTGGTGGFGLATAEWLASHGAGELLLASRSGCPRPGADADVEALERLRKCCPRVTAAACDVTDLAAVERLLRSTKQPVRGIFHCAAVFDDRPLAQMDATAVRAVLGPKANGAWNLHAVSQRLGLDLDHFVVYSSISAVLGNPAQANYAAANAFLDALARHRRALGLAGVAICWGPIGGRGYLSRAGNVAGMLSRKGWTPFAQAQAWPVLERALTPCAPASIISALVDWDLFDRAAYPAHTDSRFAGLLQSAIAAAATADCNAETSVREAAAAATTSAECATLIAVHLRRCVAKVTGASSADAIDTETGLTRLGLDSLMTNQLQTLIYTDLGVDVPLIRLVRGPTISALSRELAPSICRASNAATPAASSQSPAPARSPSPAGSDTERWLSVSRGSVADGARPTMRLLCFPFHLGGPTAFGAWAERLAATGIELVVVRVPGWESREAEATPAETERDLIAPLLAACAPLLEDGVPLVVYGHSLGSVLAYEFVSRLATPPARMFIAACPPPSFFEGRPVAEAFSFAPNSRECYKPAPGPAPCGVSAFAPELDDTFAADQVRQWERWAPAGGFEFAELPGAHHLFITHGADKAGRAASAAVLDRIVALAVDAEKREQQGVEEPAAKIASV